MKKKDKTGLIILICVGVILIAGFILLTLSGRTKKNPEDTIGNTAGNIYNLGLFCEYGDKIYFSNPNDDGALYSMSVDCRNLKKLSSDKIRYINADEHYIYYCRVNNLKENGGSIFALYNTGLFRINRKGSAGLTTISINPCSALLLSGNTIYYQHYEEGAGLSLYKAGTDGKSETPFFDEPLIPAQFYSGSLIYSGITEDRALYRLDPATAEKTMIYDGMTYFPIVNNGEIYFINLKNYYICKTNFSGEAESVVNKPCCSYNISKDGRYLYYQTDRLDKNYIGVYNLETGEDIMINEGDFKYINVTSNYVFFTDFNETTTYAYCTDGSGTLNMFTPGKLK